MFSTQYSLFSTGYSVLGPHRSSLIPRLSLPATIRVVIYRLFPLTEMFQKILSVGQPSRVIPKPRKDENAKGGMIWGTVSRLAFGISHFRDFAIRSIALRSRPSAKPVAVSGPPVGSVPLGVRIGHFPTFSDTCRVLPSVRNHSCDSWFPVPANGSRLFGPRAPTAL